jgi:hypothetical protein
MSRRRHKAPSFDSDRNDPKKALPFAAVFAVVVIVGLVLVIRGLIK